MDLRTPDPADPRGVTRRLGLAARRVVVTVLGTVVLVAGAVMLLTPGPGLVGVAAGLAILGTEYRWARRAAHRVRERSRRAYAVARTRVQARRAHRGGDPQDPSA